MGDIQGVPERHHRLRDVRAGPARRGGRAPRRRQRLVGIVIPGEELRRLDEQPRLDGRARAAGVRQPLLDGTAARLRRAPRKVHLGPPQAGRRSLEITHRITS